MSLNRFAAKVDTNQPEIVKALRKAGFDVWIIGWPCDLLVYHRKRNHWKPLEVKNNAKSKLTKDQAEMVANGCLEIVTSIEEAFKALGVT